MDIEVAIPGPRSRTDTDIARTAVSVLQWMTNLPKDSVKVIVDNGIITLSGELAWHHQKLAAGHAVRYLSGVIAVNNLITLKHAAVTADVKAQIEAALKRQSGIDADNLSVQVSGVKVTITGTVHSWAERNLIAHSAWATPGILEVVDQAMLQS